MCCDGRVQGVKRAKGEASLGFGSLEKVSLTYKGELVEEKNSQ